jgi:DNA helicase-2/ATP-dependent DNA helicase PcrA
LDLEGFNNNQKKAVLHKDGSCCVIAGAGSGKTRVLTYRIANLIEQGVKPYNILAVTFTKKASEEMKNRLEDLIEDDAEEVNVGTFHAICYKILREEWKISNHPMQNAEIAKDYWQKKIIKEYLSPPSNKFPYGLNLPEWQPRQALSFIGYQKNNLIKPGDTMIINDNIAFLEDKLNKLYKLYEDRKKLENKIDFDDMLIMCYEMLKSNPEVLGRYRDLYQYVLVDEYQDTNLAQAEILKLLAKEHRNLFVVGDDYQSIYGFRASKVELIINFEKDWPGSTVIPLDINYRSTANIVEWSNRLIAHNENQYPKQVMAYQKWHKDPVIITAYDEDEEAEIIANEIETIFNDGYKPKDFAVLYRTNAQSRAIEEAMIHSKIPYMVIGSAGFYDRKEIKDMLAYLRLSENPDDDESLERIINTPNRFLGKAFLQSLQYFSNREGCSLFGGLAGCPDAKQWKYSGARNLYRIIQELYEAELKPVKMLRLIRDLTDYDNWFLHDTLDNDDAEDRLENLNSLMTIAGKFNTVPELLEYVDNIGRNSNKNGEESNKVQLMSIHRSKGLEFWVVFVAGVNQDLLPHRNATTDEQVEEERRLCYVAMTRAKKLLYMSSTEMYQNRECGASDFIADVMDNKLGNEQIDFPWL